MDLERVLLVKSLRWELGRVVLDLGRLGSKMSKVLLWEMCKLYLH